MRFFLAPLSFSSWPRRADSDESTDSDAAEMVPHMPTVMMFAYSSNGLSHCKEEDTPIPHLQKTLEAFLLLIEKTVNHVAAAKV